MDTTTAPALNADREFTTAAGSSLKIRPGVSHMIIGIRDGMSDWISRNVHEEHVEARVAQLEEGGKFTNLSAFPETF